ncbi:MAG: SDR family oxidoreductase [Planctomycetota bacterium]
MKGRRALVTGGARRIGRAICLALADAGARVAVHYRSSEREAGEVAARCPGSALLQADLRGASEAEELVERAAGELGGLDVLVNSAAVFEKSPLGDLDEATWDLHLDTNLKGPFFAALAAGRIMRDAGSGVIVNLTDWAISRPYPAYLPYYAAKAGLSAATAGLARALAPEVRVNAVAPGPILLPEDSDRAYEEAVLKVTPLGRLGGPEAVVQAVMFLIGNDFMTGQTLILDGGRSLA